MRFPQGLYKIIEHLCGFKFVEFSKCKLQYQQNAHESWGFQPNLKMASILVARLFIKRYVKKDHKQETESFQRNLASGIIFPSLFIDNFHVETMDCLVPQLGDWFDLNNVKVRRHLTWINLSNGLLKNNFPRASLFK